MWDPYACFQRHQFPNGLVLYHQEWKERGCVAVSFLVHTGLSSDPEDKEGLAHFIEHVVSSNARRPYVELKRFFSENGGSVNLGVTGLYATHYSFLLPNQEEVVEEGFQDFSSFLIGATLNKEIEAQRKIIIAEFFEKYPIKSMYEALMSGRNTLFSYGWYTRAYSALGNLDAIRSITQEDIMSYYRKEYVPANMTIICVGDIDFASIKRIISCTSLGQGVARTRKQIMFQDAALQKPLTTKETFLLPKDMMERANYRRVFLFPLSVGEEVVGAFDHLLYKQMFNYFREEKGWVYDVRISMSHSEQFYECTIELLGFPRENLELIDSCLDICIS
ncbi:MAG: insulinase family protein, partial [Patescibacteria group bacterium]